MNVPNMITLGRIALVPVFMLLALFGGADGNYVAFGVFLVASLTDGIDGYLARKNNQVTTFGKFIDPLADKLLVTSALLVFLEFGMMPAWAIMVILSRDLVVSSLRMVAAAGGMVIQAGFSGKLKTTIHNIGIMVLLFGWGDLAVQISRSRISLQDIIICVMVIASVYSGYDYVMRNIAVIKDGISEGEKKDETV